MTIQYDNTTNQISVVGSTANLPFVLQSKGTGAIDLAAGSSGLNISNGGTVTAYTRTNPGSNLWLGTTPTVTVSAPTTAGGVQAVIAVQGYAAGATIQSGGTGYTVNDTLTLVGGTGGPATYTVLTVSAGVITSVTPLNFGQYSTVPTNPVSVTGGTGTGATLNVSYGLGTLFSITNAGSGYVEQPTLTISGQTSGSGAAAYATVGGQTILRSLGSPMSFYTGSGEAFRISDVGASTSAYWQVFGGTVTPILRAVGSASGQIQTGGATPLQFMTNNGAQEQLRVSHTASAVNYVQVTGAAAGGQVAITAQGSDTNIPLVLQPKGTGALQAQQTDSTATGGNARGANAVDWQTSRGSANQVASAIYSNILGGIGNLSGGYGSVNCGGSSNNSSGTVSVVAGGVANASNNFGTAVGGGSSNSALGYFNIIGGGFSNSATSGSAVTTQSGTMNGTTAVTLSGSNASIKVGQYITGTSIAGDTYVAAISGTSLTLSKVASGSSTSTLSFFTPHGVVVGGGNNQATGSYSFIGGGGDAGTAANRNVASGDWSVVVGGIKNTASGQASFVGGGGITSGTVLPNTASGNAASTVGGFSNTSSGFGAFIGGGFTNISNGIYSAIVGGSYGTARGISGIHVFPASNNPFSAIGTNQSSLLLLAAQTTDATATVLRSDTSAAGTANQVILPNNSAYFFKGEVIAGVTGGGNTKGWTVEGVIKRGANAASTALVGTPTVTSSYADAGASTWTIAITADTTNGGLAVTFTGQAGTTIRTVAKIETTEMTY